MCSFILGNMCACRSWNFTIVIKIVLTVFGVTAVEDIVIVKMIGLWLTRLKQDVCNVCVSMMFSIVCWEEVHRPASRRRTRCLRSETKASGCCVRRGRWATLCLKTCQLLFYVYRLKTRRQTFPLMVLPWHYHSSVIICRPCERFRESRSRFSTLRNCKTTFTWTSSTGHLRTSSASGSARVFTCGAPARARCVSTSFELFYECVEKKWQVAIVWTIWRKAILFYNCICQVVKLQEDFTVIDSCWLVFEMIMLVYN